MKFQLATFTVNRGVQECLVLKFNCEIRSIFYRKRGDTQCKRECVSVSRGESFADKIWCESLISLLSQPWHINKGGRRQEVHLPPAKYMCLSMHFIWWMCISRCITWAWRTGKEVASRRRRRREQKAQFTWNMKKERERSSLIATMHPDAGRGK